jgi:hypothetical protein
MRTVRISPLGSEKPPEHLARSCTLRAIPEWSDLDNRHTTETQNRQE